MLVRRDPRRGQPPRLHLQAHNPRQVLRVPADEDGGEHQGVRGDGQVEELCAVLVSEAARRSVLPAVQGLQHVGARQNAHQTAATEHR